MTDWLGAVVTVLLATLLLGLVRVVRGPDAADRMLSAQLFGTTGVAILLIQAVATDASGLLDVALVLAVLAPITAVAFVHLAGNRP